MSEPPVVAQSERLKADFAAAARLLRCGDESEATATPLPPHLSERELALRVHLLIAAGVAATARLAPARVRDLLADPHTEPLDLLITLVALYARLDPGGSGSHP